MLELTAAGQETLARARQASDDAERVLLAPLSPHDGQQLREALQRIVAHRAAGEG